MPAISEWIQRVKWRNTKFNGAQYKNMTVQEIFSIIYKYNIWGGKRGTFYSGAGTADAQTAIYIKMLASFILNNHITSIVEIGCGDFSIMNNVLNPLKDIHYLGLDVVPELIEHNKINFGSTHISFDVCNAIDHPLPSADLLIIRQVLQHLDNNSISKILEKTKTFPYAIITEHLPVTETAQYNLDKAIGPTIRMKSNSGVFIDKPPFSLLNTRILLEYRADDTVRGNIIPAVMRTYLFQNNNK